VRRHLRIAVAGSLVALVVLAVWQGLREREPSYQGRPLRAWLADFRSSYPWLPGQDEAKRALAGETIRPIGTNALPALMAMTRAKDSELYSRVAALARNQEAIRAHFWTESDERLLAASGFRADNRRDRSASPLPSGALSSITKLESVRGWRSLIKSVYAETRRPAPKLRPGGSGPRQVSNAGIR
jgi:hypothetical protein